MSIFNFGRRQRLHTQLYGNTNGREMFKIDEYNHIKKITYWLSGTMFIIFTLFYFCWSEIPLKLKGFIGLIFIGGGIWNYFNIKHQIKVRKSLY